MTPLQIIFLAAAAVTLGAAVMVVSSRKLLHAALWLILTLAGVAVFFVLLNASFLAVVQVVVYIGAIAILIIFAVMLTRRVMQDSSRQSTRLGWLGLLAALLLFGGLAVLVLQVPAFQVGAGEAPDPQASLSGLGRSLVDVNAFILPFELASVLLLAAMIGAMFVARPEGSKPPAGKDGMPGGEA
jgi:NADH-quinone oxidoreductase subunit J